MTVTAQFVVKIPIFIAYYTSQFIHLIYATAPSKSVRETNMP
jgi:hypothetical protein